ncbi:MAG: hypothetical protein ACI4JW_00095 [Oscillospiraceae bacterium]
MLVILAVSSLPAGTVLSGICEVPSVILAFHAAKVKRQHANQIVIPYHLIIT